MLQVKNILLLGIIVFSRQIFAPDEEIISELELATCKTNNEKRFNSKTPIQRLGEKITKCIFSHNKMKAIFEGFKSEEFIPRNFTISVKDNKSSDPAVNIEMNLLEIFSVIQNKIEVAFHCLNQNAATRLDLLEDNLFLDRITIYNANSKILSNIKVPEDYDRIVLDSLHKNMQFEACDILSKILLTLPSVKLDLEKKLDDIAKSLRIAQFKNFSSPTTSSNFQKAPLETAENLQVETLKVYLEAFSAPINIAYTLIKEKYNQEQSEINGIKTLEIISTIVMILEKLSIPKEHAQLNDLYDDLNDQYLEEGEEYNLSCKENPISIEGHLIATYYTAYNQDDKKANKFVFCGFEHSGAYSTKPTECYIVIKIEEIMSYKTLNFESLIIVLKDFLNKYLGNDKQRSKFAQEHFKDIKLPEGLTFNKQKEPNPLTPEYLLKVLKSSIYEEIKNLEIEYDCLYSSLSEGDISVHEYRNKAPRVFLKLLELPITKSIEEFMLNSKLEKNDFVQDLAKLTVKEETEDASLPDLLASTSIEEFIKKRSFPYRRIRLEMIPVSKALLEFFFSIIRKSQSEEIAEEAKNMMSAAWENDLKKDLTTVERAETMNRQLFLDNLPGITMALVEKVRQHDTCDNFLRKTENSKDCELCGDDLAKVAIIWDETPCCKRNDYCLECISGFLEQEDITCFNCREKVSPEAWEKVVTPTKLVFEDEEEVQGKSCSPSSNLQVTLEE